MKARFIALFSVLSLASVSEAATFNFTGTVRSEAGSYNNLGLGGNTTFEGTKNFITARALLNPNLVVDDHFSVKSQWSLLSSPNFTPAANAALGSGQGSYLFGDVNSSAFLLSRAWLEWTSDVGVFRLGRMPVSWGYGVVYDSGDNMWDDFQTTMDRIEYRLHLGYVVGALAYSKNRKISTIANNDDQEFYTAYVRYDNPEVEVEAGLMFEKQQRRANQANALMTGSDLNQPGVTGTGAGGAIPFLSARKPTLLGNTLVDVYLKKTSGYFSYGGEVSWVSGTAADYSTNNAGANSFAVMLNAGLEYRKVKSFLEVLLVTGDDNLNDGQLSGFTLVNRNRRPGLILGREMVGPYYANNIAQGSPLVYGANNTYSGILYFRPGVKFDWSTTLTSSIEAIFARKVADVAGADLNLGLEFDAGTEYAVYKNFRLGADVAVLFPSAGIGYASPSAAFAFRGTAALSF